MKQQTPAPQPVDNSKLDALWDWLEENTVRLAQAGDPRALALLADAACRKLPKSQE